MILPARQIAENGGRRFADVQNYPRMAPPMTAFRISWIHHISAHISSYSQPHDFYKCAEYN